MADSENYRKFSQVIRGLCDEARTGTLFVRTADHHASMVLFDQGKITGVYYGSVKGRKAIAMLRMSEGLTHHFEDGRPLTVRQDLGSPAETFEELVGGTGVSPPAAARQPVPEAASRTVGRPDQLGLDTVMARILEKQLGKYIGPAARSVIGQAQRSALAVATNDELRRVIGALSADLLEPDEQAEFEQEAMRQINALFSGAALPAVSAQLTECLGPVGRSVFSDALAELGGEVNGPGEIERLVASLVRRIDSAGEAQEFVKRVRGALESLAS